MACPLFYPRNAFLLDESTELILLLLVGNLLGQITFDVIDSKSSQFFKPTFSSNLSQFFILLYQIKFHVIIWKRCCSLDFCSLGNIILGLVHIACSY